MGVVTRTSLLVLRGEGNNGNKREEEKGCRRVIPEQVRKGTWAWDGRDRGPSVPFLSLSLYLFITEKERESVHKLGEQQAARK